MIKDNQIKKILVFQIWGDYGHFRKNYTTSSPLTHSIPPRTALCGLIGAILGLEKNNNEYLSYFTLDKAKIALRLINPVKKVHISENLIDTKSSKGIGMNLIENRTQIRFEFLKDQKYKVYFWHYDNDLYKRLKKYLQQHKSVYTPCFGLSENIVNFKFIGEYDVIAKSPATEFIHSVIPTEKIEEKAGIDFDSQGEYFSLRLPCEMNQERIITKYSDILFERNGNPIKVKMIESYFDINYDDGIKENIVFIE
ncbi:MAG: type I-B CRISPR-associated protein Cas5b [bacterium]